jgi:hypothetical protein
VARKKSRQRKQHRGPPDERVRTLPPAPTRRRHVPDPRIESAHRRAALAKAVIGTGGTIAFGAAMVLARHSYAGHSKQPATPLTAPERFVSVVRRNLLQAGILAPASAPASATTAAS